jgi:hypothetical protein
MTGQNAKTVPRQTSQGVFENGSLEMILERNFIDMLFLNLGL